ncbi:hypothetical protein NliqN6_2301 [Naganishia liquefaciens]|uniref:SDR family NAD(P)-dependent oxidoreductase n=1 Tax=Naganishia liquefaciens TaxID=104408 RepID=A0A8H3YDZ8_9TREE|nr:hypothetical protein NliqN6_2301 [Naganishia liquefaciens]
MDTQILREAFPPAATWTAQDVPDMTGKVCAVTGGYGGVGYHTTKALLARGAKVYVLARSESKFQSAIQRLAAENPPIVARPHFIPLDLASRTSPLDAARDLASRESRLDVLFCNAGVMVPPSGSLTDEGYDLQWATNVMGHWILTTALIPLLENVYDASGRAQKARVVHTSSSGHRFAPRGAVDWESLKPEGAGPPPKLGNWALYGQSKIGNILVANELDRRHGAKIISTSCNPGNLQTDLPRHLKQSIFIRLVGFIEPLLTYPAHLGALTQLYLGTAPDVAGGAYGIPWARIGDPREDAKDPETARKVWEWLERECRV